jgi:dTDP-glucose 4,6-dehydratase
LVRAYHRTYGLPVTISNCCNNYGPYQFPEKLIPLMIINALDGKPLPIYGDGRHIRDWLYSEDHCRGIERVLIRGRVGEAYNLGGENELLNLEIVRLICRLIDEVFGTDPALAERFPAAPPSRGEKSEKLITFVADRPGHDLRYSIDPTKARTELGFRARVKFLSGLGKTLAWYLANEEWWRAVMDGRYRAWRAKHYGDDGAPAATS